MSYHLKSSWWLLCERVLGLHLGGFRKDPHVHPQWNTRTYLSFVHVDVLIDCEANSLGAFWGPLLNHMHIHIWEVKKRLQHDMYRNGIGLCAQSIHMAITHYMNVVRRTYGIILMRERLFTLTSYDFYVSTLILWFWIRIDHIHDSSLLLYETHPKTIEWPRLYVQLNSAHKLGHFCSIFT